MFHWIGVAFCVSLTLLGLSFAIAVSSLWLKDGVDNSWEYWQAKRLLRRWERAVKRRQKGGDA